MKKFSVASALWTILLTLISAQVFAAGSFTLSGQVRGFSNETIDIFDGERTYSIQRKKLETNRQAKLKDLKVGAKLKLQVPFDAVITAGRAEK